MGIGSSWEAFCVDRAVYTFGVAFRTELDSVSGKSGKETKRKREQVYFKWFPEARQERKFADPRKA